MYRAKKPIVGRSDTYRSEYIKTHPGFNGLYMCRYCGRIMKRSEMQVDHVIAINYVNKSNFFRRFFKDKKALNEKLNSPKNLVPACPRCNARKSDNGGVWIIKGKIGLFSQTVSWLLFLFFCYVYYRWILRDIWTWML